MASKPSHRLLITAAQGRVSISNGFTVDVEALLSIARSNAGRTVSIAFIARGTGLGVFNVCPVVETGKSSCESSNWRSDTSVMCFLPMGQAHGRSLRLLLTAGSAVGTLTHTFSYDHAILNGDLSIANTAPMKLDKTLVMSGLFPSLGASSIATRLGSSQCQASQWISASSVSCKFLVSRPGKVVGVVITASEQATGSSTGSFTVDVPVVSRVDGVAYSNAAARIGMFAELSGSNFGM